MTKELIEEERFHRKGFTYFFSKTNKNPAHYIVYVNAKPENIFDVVNKFVPMLDEKKGIPQIKCANSESQGANRKDSVLLYVNSMEDALRLAKELEGRLQGLVRIEVPYMTDQISAGIAIAPEPTKDQIAKVNACLDRHGLEQCSTLSFGGLRATVMCVALSEMRYWTYKGERTPEAFKRRCEAILTECDIPLPTGE